ncbi:MAG TPA: GAF domain-containing protein [Terriglobales bacterium]|nr:GAF domain-containing protein [Terriglobales bacterium]
MFSITSVSGGLPKTMAHKQDLSFIALETAVFCMQCELISRSTTAYCVACGSQAILSLSRILGGSLRGQPTARLITDNELDRLVRDLISTVPAAAQENHLPTSFATLAPSRHHARALASEATPDSRLRPGHELCLSEIDLEPAIHIIAERAQALTGATGAAIALRQGEEMVCRARTGRTAPDLGVRLQTDAGITADCVRTGEVVLCPDTERNPSVDLATCRRLGVRSVLAAPLRHYRRMLGVFEVLSVAPYAFDNRDIRTIEVFSSTIVAAMSRLASLRSSRRQAS